MTRTQDTTPARAEAQDEDTPCTDCGDTGVTHQTERRCSCQEAEAQDEGAAGEPVAWRYRFLGNSETDAAAWAEGHWAVTIHPRSSCTLYEVKPLYTHPSPPAAAEAASRNNVTSGDEVWVKAKASDVCTSCCGVRIPTIHERDVYTYVHWSSVSLSPPPADDALRVAVEALEKIEDLPAAGTPEHIAAAIASEALAEIAALKAGGVK